MAQIQRYPILRHLRADASRFILHFRNGALKRAGRGLAFWFQPDGASIAEVPMDDRQLPFMLRGQSADYQDIAVQGSLVWRVADPERLAARIDFSIDLASGETKAQPLDQINDVLLTLARRYVLAYLKRSGVRALLEAGVAPLGEAVAAGVEADGTLEGLGLDLVAFAVADVSPTRELARALQAPTFEGLQAAADEAGFARRALAVEKERAIAENELATKVELAARRAELIERESGNAREEAEAKAGLRRIEAETEAGRIRAVGSARAEAEESRVRVYADMPPSVVMALAAREFAAKLERVDSVTLTPDMIGTLVGQIRGALDGVPAPLPAALPARTAPARGTDAAETDAARADA